MKPPKIKIAKRTVCVAVLSETYRALIELAARCDMSQGQALDALVQHGHDRVLKLHDKTKKEPTR